MISILARDGVDTQGRAPHRRMNLLTLISLLKNQVKINDAILKEFKMAVLHSLDTAGRERYVLRRMC